MKDNHAVITIQYGSQHTSKQKSEIIVNTGHLDLVIKWDLLMAADYC